MELGGGELREPRVKQRERVSPKECMLQQIVLRPSLGLKPASRYRWWSGMNGKRISLKKRIGGEAISLSVLLMLACSLSFSCSNALSHCAHTFHAHMLTYNHQIRFLPD